jgi:hypothetical protein
VKNSLNHFPQISSIILLGAVIILQYFKLGHLSLLATSILV